MFVYKFRPDGVYEGPVEVPDGTSVIPRYHTFSQPPEIPQGYYAVMAGGWRLVEGTAPTYPPAPTPEQIQAKIVNQVQNRLDEFAQTRSYDDIKSACDYAGCSVARFSTEGQYCKDKRAETWDILYTMLAEVQAGTRPMPTDISDIEAELPVLEWPV